MPPPGTWGEVTVQREVLSGTVHWVLGTGGPDEGLDIGSFSQLC